MFELEYEINGAECLVELQPGVLTIGRAPGNDIVIDDRSVSGKHARLTVEQDEATITDLHSSNGTRVDNRRIDSATLRGGERILLGRIAMRFNNPDAAPADADADAAAAADPDETPPRLDAVAPPSPGGHAPAPAAAPPAGALVPTAPRQGQNAVEVLPPSPGGAGTGAAAPTRDDAAKRKRALLLAGLAAAAVILAGIVLFTPPEQPQPPKPGFSPEQYAHGLLQGLEAAEKDDFVEAHRVWAKADRLWEEAHPDRRRVAAGRLADMVEDLVEAQKEKQYEGVDWFAISDKAREFHVEVANVPDEVQDWTRDLDSWAMTEADHLETLRSARRLLARQEFAMARVKADEIPPDSVYVDAAKELAAKADRLGYEQLVQEANRLADEQKWAEAIAKARDALRRRDNPGLADAVEQWRQWAEDQRKFRAARKDLEKGDRPALEQHIALLSAIAEDSPYRDEAEALVRTMRLRVRKLTVDELFAAFNVGALEKLAEQDPAFAADPHYQNTMKKVRDIQRAFAAAREAEQSGKYEEVVALADRVRDIVPDRKHPKNKEARDLAAEYSPTKRAERRLEDGREALRDKRYKAARTHFEKAKELGVEATKEAAQKEIDKMLLLARDLYNRGVNKSSRYDKLDYLKKALDCQRPGDPLYKTTLTRYQQIEAGG